MASFRKPAATNKQLKSPPFANDINYSDTKFKGRGSVNGGGVIVPNRIFVGGICPKATTDDLAALFRKYGAVTTVKIVVDQNGSSKGYGFVTFEKADDVSKLQCDAENLFINNKQLNIAPAIMKYPQSIGRYTDSIVMPLPPNLYFTNGLPYQYSEGAPVYPNNSYTPQVAVLPAVSDAAYYSTPYHGTALFYPLSPSTPQIVVGSHQPYSSYQPMHSSNSNYAYSSPASQTASPPNSTGKTSSLNAPTNTINTTDMHVSQGTPIMTSMPPNMTSLPPPVPYPVSHPPQYYNGTVLPQFASDMYYNMVPGTCYPMMTVNGQDTYVPYYEVGEPCNANISSECHLICAQETSIDAPTTYSISVPGPPPYPHSELIGGGKESSPPAPANGPHANDSTKALVPLGPPPVTAAASEHVTPEHPYSAAVAENNAATNNNNNGGSSISSNHSKNTNNGQNHASHHSNNGGAGSIAALTQQPPLPPPPQPQQQMQPPHAADYSASSAFIHRSSATTAIIYPNAPMPQPSLYFNSAVYMSEATSASLVGPCPYSNKLSENYVSDHLPKRDAKLTPKKFNGGSGGNGNAPLPSNGGGGVVGVNNGVAGANHHHQQQQPQQQHHHGNSGGANGGHNAMKDAPPNIPKFPFLVNNNYPGYVNRNVKEKEYKVAGAAGMGGPKGMDGKPAPRVPRHNSIGGGPPPKPRIFHNQNQYSGAGGPPPRAHRFERNGHLMPNVQYSRSQGPIMSRQNSYEQQQPPYDYANSHPHHYHHHHHQGHPSGYMKPMGYEGHHPRRYHPGNNNGGGYRGSKHDRNNGPVHHDGVGYQKNHAAMDEPRAPRKYNHQPDESSAHAPATTNTSSSATSTSSNATDHTRPDQSPDQSSTPPSSDGGGSSSSVNAPAQPVQPPSQTQAQQQPQPQPPPTPQLCAEMQKLAV